MSIKRALHIVLVASAVMLAVGIGPQFGGYARALPLAQASGVTIPYPGNLTDAAGQPVADGAYDFAFALYDAPEGGALLWSEVQTGVAVQGGAFTAALGSVSSLPDAAKGRGLWLEVGVRGPGEAGFTLLSPRQAWNAVAFLAPASPSAGPTCAHDHLGEDWVGAYTPGLRVEDTTYNGTGIQGVAYSGSSAWGVYGDSTDGRGVVGESTNGIGASGFSENGTGVRGYSVAGAAILAGGTGIISSTADSVLYLSPHSMVNRGSANVTLTPQGDGSMLIRGTAGTEDKYLSIPVSTFGTLFGAPVYVKAVEVCFAAGLTGKIRATAVIKNNGGTGFTYYIYEAADHIETSHYCYTLNAATPRTAIDNSTWVQLNVAFSYPAIPGPTVIIYTVKLTLTESPS